jgi:hypothetical protein
LNRRKYQMESCQMRVVDRKVVPNPDVTVLSLDFYMVNQSSLVFRKYVHTVTILALPPSFGRICAKPIFDPADKHSY